jgi:hypothetical protein
MQEAISALCSIRRVRKDGKITVKGAATAAARVQHADDLQKASDHRKKRRRDLKEASYQKMLKDRDALNVAQMQELVKTPEDMSNELTSRATDKSKKTFLSLEFDGRVLGRGYTDYPLACIGMQYRLKVRYPPDPDEKTRGFKLRKSPQPGSSMSEVQYLEALLMQMVEYDQHRQEPICTTNINCVIKEKIRQDKMKRGRLHGNCNKIASASRLLLIHELLYFRKDWGEAGIARKVRQDKTR